METPPASSPFDTFVAIDFETADHQPDSACAVALVRVENGEIIYQHAFLIRPPRQEFVFSYLHGITWKMVEKMPAFGDLWPDLEPALDGAAFLAAHNAPFDRSVLQACCAAAGLKPPSLPFRCTVQLARKKWRLYPTKLSDVCRYLDIPLNHHDALSDATACAKIILAARNDGKK
jgi:DNA polymerase-3 subunit epsilon